MLGSFCVYDFREASEKKVSLSLVSWRGIFCTRLIVIAMGPEWKNQSRIAVMIFATGNDFKFMIQSHNSGALKLSEAGIQSNV